MAVGPWAQPPTAAQCENRAASFALCTISDYRCYHQFSEKLSPVADHAVRVRFL